MTDPVKGQAPTCRTPAPLAEDLRDLLPPLDPATRAAVVEALADLALAALDADAGELPAGWDTVAAAPPDRPAAPESSGNEVSNPRWTEGAASC